jgi:hypothetical protein
MYLISLFVGVLVEALYGFKGVTNEEF